MSADNCGYSEGCEYCGRYHCALTPEARAVLCPSPDQCVTTYAPCNEGGLG